MTSSWGVQHCQVSCCCSTLSVTLCKSLWISPEWKARTQTHTHTHTPTRAQALGSCRVGMVWKTAKSRKWGKNGKNGKQPPAGQGQKMAKNWLFEEVFHLFFHFRANFWPFSPLSSWGLYSIWLSIFFSVPALAVFHAMPAQHDPNTSKTKLPKESPSEDKILYAHLMESKGEKAPLHGDLGSDILFPYRSRSARGHPDPTQHPETDPKRTETDPKWTEIKPLRVGRSGGFVGMGGGCHAPWILDVGILYICSCGPLPKLNRLWLASDERCLILTSS